MPVSKLGGGVLADRPDMDRRSIAAAGYLVTGAGHAAFALAQGAPAVAVARAVSWSARGLRGPSRDALLAGGVPPEQLGRAFGVERAGDSAGAVLGPVLAALLLPLLGERWVFAVSSVPAVGAALAIVLLTRGAHAGAGAARRAGTSLGMALRETPDRFRRLLLAIALYGLGNFSSTLLILRATQILSESGRSAAAAATTAISLYTLHNAANALAAYPAGALADRVGRRMVLAAGIGLFAGACALFATGPSDVFPLGVLFGAVGSSKALVETGQNAHAAELLPAHLRGRGYGLLGLVDGVGDLISSVVVGALWTVMAPAWGFAYAAALSVAALLSLLLPSAAGGTLDAAPGRSSAA